MERTKTHNSFSAVKDHTRFLRELVDELDSCRTFVPIVNHCFPPEEAVALIHAFVTEVYNPVKEMQETAERAEQLVEGAPPTPAQKIAHARKPLTEVKLSEKMGMIFSKRSMIELSCKARDIAHTLEEKLVDGSIDTELKANLLLAHRKAISTVSQELFVKANTLDINQEGAIESLYTRVKALEQDPGRGASPAL